MERQSGQLARHGLNREKARSRTAAWVLKSCLGTVAIVAATVLPLASRGRWIERPSPRAPLDLLFFPFVGGGLGALSMFAVGRWKFRGDARGLVLPAARASRLTEAEPGLPALFEGALTLPDGEALTAPVSQRRCAYYRVEVQEWVEAKDIAEWRTRFEEWRVVTFVVRDQTAAALVEAPWKGSSDIGSDYVAADLHLSRSAQAYESNDGVDGLPKAARGFVTSNRQLRKRLAGQEARLRVLEMALQEGDVVTVEGTARPNRAGTGAAYRGGMLKIEGARTVYPMSIDDARWLGALARRVEVLLTCGVAAGALAVGFGIYLLAAG